MDWKTRFEHEMSMALEARSRGNEGQARVCARRAAGAAVREYFLRRGLPAGSSSAFDLLKQLQDLPELPEKARNAAAHLTLRVNEEFNLPVEVDLMEEARALAADLLDGPDITL